MNNKTDNNFLLLLIVISIIIGEIALIYNISMPKLDTRELTVRQMTFGLGNGNGTITAPLTNSGTYDVTVALIKVNGNTIPSTNWEITQGTDVVTTILPGDDATLTITMDVGSGNKYAVNIFIADGTMVGSYTDTA